MKLLISFLFFTSLFSFAQQQSAISKVSWLAGCWQTNESYYVSREQWMPPNGKMMVGISHTVSKGETLGYEYLRIEERAGRLLYIANPTGEAETEFKQVQITDSSVVFQNLSNEFPQRIIYRKIYDGTIMARVEGSRDGTVEAIDIPMRPVDCLK